MIAISDHELLSIWEAAQTAHPIARPAMLLRAAGEHEAPEQLPIGARDRKILALRERWFGRAFESIAECPRCRTAVEMTFETPAATETGTLPQPWRLPNTVDLLAASACRDAVEARALLATRCSGETALSDDAIDAIAAAMEQADPDGDLRVSLTCADCGTTWDAQFDPALHLWRELETTVQRVFAEVDALARAYGWSESEVLAMPAARRAIYLRMVTE